MHSNLEASANVLSNRITTGMTSSKKLSLLTQSKNSGESTYVCPTSFSDLFCLHALFQNNITPTSELAIKSDYHLFKSGVRPEWEDPQNKHGGKWSYSFMKQGRNKPIPIDDTWLHLMLAAIGETLENDGDGEVMGVVVNVRKQFYRVCVWTKSVGKPFPGAGDGDVAGGKGRTSEKAKAVLTGIGQKFKAVLDIEANEAVEFSGHTESAHSGSTRAKAKFIV
jgi:translation initiation factor 4E